MKNRDSGSGMEVRLWMYTISHFYAKYSDVYTMAVLHRCQKKLVLNRTLDTSIPQLSIEVRMLFDEE